MAEPEFLLLMLLIAFVTTATGLLFAGVVELALALDRRRHPGHTRDQVTDRRRDLSGEGE
jgi:hypothetical protein